MGVIEDFTGIPFPTGVGMNRRNRQRRPLLTTVPHRRGDEPYSRRSCSRSNSRSPQAWG